MATAPKVLLICFDGADWNVIGPLLRAGRLPRLAAFMRAGSHGTLRSLEGVPLASPILWTSLASGKLPSKHGIKDFYDTAPAVRCARLWEIFEHERLPIGLFRYLVTWPPRRTAGFIVPDRFGRTPEAFPAALSFINTMETVKDFGGLVRNGVKALRHGMRASTAVVAVTEALRERVLRSKLLDIRHRQLRLELGIHADLFVRLLASHRPYFAAFYTALPDAVQHEYWKFMEPEQFRDVLAVEVARYGRVIPEVYEALDRVLGRLLRHVGPQTLVVIASDHGGEANVDEEFRRARVRTQGLIEALGLIGVMSAFQIGVRAYFRLRSGSSVGGSIREIADRVRAVTLDNGAPVPVFHVEVSGDQEMIVEEVIHLKGSTEGVQLRFPDGRTFPVDRILALTSTISGRHSMEGVLLLRGPHVRPRHEISGATLLDVTPTILALLGRPVGRDMDGRVLTDAIDSEFLRRHPVQVIDSYDVLLGRCASAAVEGPGEGAEIVTQRLRELGYIE